MLTDAELATRCGGAALPTTAGLCAHSTGDLPLHAALEFVSVGSPAALAQSDIAGWAERQLRAGTAPVHPLLAEFLDRLARRCVPAEVGATDPIARPLRREFIEELLTECELDNDDEDRREKRAPARVLALLHVLSYRAAAVRVLPLPTAYSCRAPAWLAYPDELYERLPIRWLMSVVEVRGADFRAIRPQLLQLVADQHPHLLATQPSIAVARAVLQGTESGRRVQKTPEEMLALAERLRNSAAKPVDSLAAAKEIEETMTISQQAEMLDAVAELLSVAEDDDGGLGGKIQTPTPYPLTVDVALRIWTRVEAVSPLRACSAVARVWLRRTRIDDVPDELTEEPLHLFKVSRRLWTAASPPALVGAFLRTLDHFRAAARARTARKLAAPVRDAPFVTPRAECKTLALVAATARDAAMVHALLEAAAAAHKTGQTSRGATKARSTRTARLICAHVHRLFIEDTDLMRLVIFQGIPLGAVRMAVELIPSLFAVVEYVPEMLSLLSLQRRIFAVVLVCELAAKYRVPGVLAVCELTLDVLHTLLHAGAEKDTVALFARATPYFKRLLAAFPHLAGDVAELLLAVRQLAMTRLALHGGRAILHPVTDVDAKLVADVDRVLQEGLEERVEGDVLGT